MAVGGGFAVGVTVVPIDAAPSPWEPVDPQPQAQVDRLGAWLPRRRSSSESAALMQQVTAAEAKLAAFKLELALDIAADRPAPVDPRPGEAGAAGVGPDGVSEFVLDELALILNTSRTAPVTLLDQAQIFATRLPATWAELAAGRLDWPRARAIAAELGRPADDSDPAVVAAVERAVLPIVTELSVRRLRERVHRELVALNAGAVDRRLKQARLAADVGVRRIGNGMSELSMRMPHPEAVACRKTLDAHARAAQEAGDRRPIGMLRVGAGIDLILRPWQEQPPVTAHVTVIAPLEALRVGAFLDAGSALPAAFVPDPAPAPVGEWTAKRSPPPTCVSCSSSWTPCARAGCRRRPAARSTSPSPTRAAGSSRSPAAGTWNASWPAAARPTPARRAAARCSQPLRPWTATARRRGSAASSSRATAPAAIRGAT
ncbi:DUF222 domain-containing protein [Blastococcus goldschmidtiae]|uniref:DUF222 domain-containing protein n=1 Tax=Blastococcus goldschmidtiae TaxID=3075546 RepID=A0ABU2K7F3_9ACTN|nr:DUF222 domain-containing protein [Blastococcus sp. DSM 46792]MDT0276132.1 DUF222 domain-containing protein [Blastococcus sp. DSM 46792]